MHMERAHSGEDGALDVDEGLSFQEDPAFNLDRIHHMPGFHHGAVQCFGRLGWRRDEIIHLSLA